MNTFQKSAAVINKVVTPVLSLPGVSKIAGKAFTVVTYTGRKSGKQFQLPVSYVRKGDRVIIGVALPDQKTWWRNFSGEGAPITLTLDGNEVAGHAVSTRDDKGHVKVRVDLATPGT